MTRCLSERELYAATDTRLGARRMRHLASCAGCAARVGRVAALRAAVRAASAPVPPDWDKLETRILREISAAHAPRPSPRWALAPFGLAAAAAALIVVAIALGRQPGTEAPVPPRPLPGNAVAEGTARARVPLAAAVAERFGVCAPDRGARVLEDAQVDCGVDGGARIALGDDIAVDELGPSRLVVASLDEWRPAIRLDSGAYRISVSEGVLPQELVVLAAHEEITVFSGTVDLLLADEVIEIRAAGGPARVELGGALRELAPGAGLRGGGGDGGDGVALASTWAPLPVEWTADEQSAVSLLDLARPRGTLPKQVVREVMRGSAERMRACYETALKRQPGLEDVQLTARLRVGSSGRIVRSSLSGAEPLPDLKRCLAGVLEGMRFPPPTGGDVDLIAPLRLTPRE